MITSTLHSSRPRRVLRLLAATAAVCILGITSPVRTATAQIQAAGADPAAVRQTSTDPVVLTLQEAVQIALASNYAVRNNRLDVENANAQVKEAWGQVLPQVSANASYTRNVKTANPFAGSEAGGLFGSLGFVDWLAFNEQARVDEDPNTSPISFDEFQQRRQEGLQDAGVSSGSSSNPFGVPNQVQSGITVSQTLYNGSAFAAIAGAQRLKDVNKLGLDRQQQVIVDQVRQAFYQALLAQQQSNIVEQSVNRTRATLEETARRVAQGVAPKFQRLSAEVEVSNLETQLVQTRNQAASAVDNLKFTLGIPVGQPIRLRGTLDVDDATLYQTVSVENAVEAALERRPDVQQARIGIELREIDKRITRAQYFPTLSAFANFNYNGNVPDNRTVTISDPNDPFSFSTKTRGVFSDSYWQPSVNVGVRLSWNIFNGFQTRAQVQQRQIAVERAELQYAQQLQSMRLEVETALRNLEAARRRIASQRQNVDRAELNYQFASKRLSEGVATPLEERQASEQLDQSRINYLQAVYDYLTARSAFETAIGAPLASPGTLNLTTN